MQMWCGGGGEGEPKPESSLLSRFFEVPPYFSYTVDFWSVHLLHLLHPLHPLHPLNPLGRHASVGTESRFQTLLNQTLVHPARHGPKRKCREKALRLTKDLEWRPTGLSRLRGFWTVAA